MRKQEKRHASGTHHIYAHSDLYNGARFSVERAIASEEGQYYNCMNTILLSAFATEAYLNYAGSKIFEDWNEKEGMSPESKLEIICSTAGLKPDYSVSPFQQFKEIFGFRNRVVHCRSENLLNESSVSENDNLRSKPQTKWQHLCTVEKAKSLFDGIGSLIETIHKATGLDEPALGLVSSGFYSIERNRTRR